MSKDTRKISTSFRNIQISLFGWSGFLAAVAVLGFLSGLIGLFARDIDNVDFELFVCVVWALLTIIVVLVQLYFSDSDSQHITEQFEVPMEYNKTAQCFLIRKNPSFSGHVIVGCYIKEPNSSIERLAFLGNVHHHQAEFIQIKIVRAYDQSIAKSLPDLDVKSLIIRPSVPLDALAKLDGDYDA